MSGNPYSKILKVTENEPSKSEVLIGEVVLSNPLNVQIGELLIGKGDIFIADHLLKGHQRKVSLKGEVLKFRQSNPDIPMTTYGEPGHTHTVKSIEVNSKEVEVQAKGESSYIQTEDTLNIGDKLAILQVSNEQKYIVIARLKEV